MLLVSLLISVLIKLYKTRNNYFISFNLLIQLIKIIFNTTFSQQLSTTTKKKNILLYVEKIPILLNQFILIYLKL